jgi:hypothetical protein
MPSMTSCLSKLLLLSIDFSCCLPQKTRSTQVGCQSSESICKLKVTSALTYPSILKHPAACWRVRSASQRSENPLIGLPATLTHHHQRQCLIALAVTNLWRFERLPVPTAEPLSKPSVIRVSPCIDRNPENFSALPVFTTKTTLATIRSVPLPKNARFITTKPSPSCPKLPNTSAAAGYNQSKFGVSAI